MIILSGVLVVLAIALLIAGVVFGNSGTEVVGLDGLTLIYVSIAVSIVSALCLAIGVFLRRRELFGGAPGSSPGKAPKGRKKARKKAGKAATGLDPAGGETTAEDTLKIPVQPVDVPGDALVHVVRGRKRYHLDNCRQLVGRQKEELTYAEAQEEGFSPCTACMPDTALAARAAVAGDKGPGATGKPEGTGAPAGRGDATGSAKTRRDKTAPGASASMGVGGTPPSPDQPAGDRMTSTAGSGGRGPLSPRTPYSGSASGEETATRGRHGRRRDEAATAAERATPGKSANRPASESTSIWLPPAASAPAPRRGGRPADERAKPPEDAGGVPTLQREPETPADSATTTEFEAVEPTAETRTYGTRTRGTQTHGTPEDRTPEDGATEDRTPEDGATEGRTAEDGAAEGRTAEDGKTEDGKTEGKTEDGKTEGRTADGRAPEDRATEDGPPEPGDSAPAGEDDSRGTAQETSADAAPPAAEVAEVTDRTGDQTGDQNAETGDRASEDGPAESSGEAHETAPVDDGPQVRILSGTRRYHRSDCALIVDIGDDADDIEALSRAEAMARGCTPCLVCEPDKEHARD